MSRPVVVGVAEKQPNVLTFAVQEARTTQSPLRVVHATGIHPPTAGSFAGGLVVEELRQAGRPVLDDAEHLIHDEAPGLDANFVLTSETPVRALEHTSSGARLLVLGSDEVPWFDGLAHRRISGHMALHAECPVVVVPSDSPTRTTGDLVLTLDGDTAAEGPIRYAFEQAQARDAVLHVLHVTPADAPTHEADQIKTNISEVLAGWRAEFPDVRVVKGFVTGDPTNAIVQATQNAAALVIVGRPHEHHLPFPETRPLATEVLRRANCPVAIVPPTYAGG
jgi:nucleotide-binding universal stress UspA family protein